MYVLIIGGGVVGLLTAIKLKQKKFSVDVFEARPTYTRKQILLFNKNSMDLLPKSVKNKLFNDKNSKGCYVMSPMKDSSSTCYKSGIPTASIMISEIENELSKYAKQIGVNIIKPTKKMGKQLPTYDKRAYTITFMNKIYDISDYDYLIGADGGNSFVRNSILNAKFVKNVSKTTYGLVVNLKTTPKKLGPIKNKPTSNIIKQVDKADAIPTRRMFKSKNGSYYVGLAINKKIYDTIYKNKILPDYVYHMLDTTCNIANGNCNSKKEIINYQTFPIIVKKSTKYHNIINNTHVFIIGDASMTTHFFTGSGVNTGIAGANDLVKIMKNVWHDDKKLNKKQMNAWSKKMEGHAKDLNKKVLSVINPIDKLIKKCMKSRDPKLLAFIKKIKNNHKLSKNDICYIVNDTIEY